MSLSKIAHSGQSVDLSANTVFRPAFTTLVLQTGSTAPTDELGVTTLIRRWKCRRDLAQSFFAQRGDRDFQFEDLRLIDFTPTDEGAITTIEERYNGFIGGEREPVVIERVVNQTKEVTLHNANGSLTLVYICPTLTRIYATAVEPKLQDYYEYQGFLRPVRKLHFRNVTGQPITSTGATAALLKLFSFQVKSLRTQFDPQPDGHVWRVTEVIERQIVQEAADEFGILNIIT